MIEYKLGSGLIDGKATPLLLIEDKAYRLADILGYEAPDSLEAVFAAWDRFETLIGERAANHSATGFDPAEADFLPPLSNPRKVICIGTNYHDHLEEMKVTDLPEFPYAFMRPQNCLAAHREDIPLPDGAKMNDWEAELGIIIGQEFGPADNSDPMGAVAGYTVVNDVSARDWIESRPFVGIDWIMQKGWDKFQPTGPWITPARFVPDPKNLDIVLRVNGQVKQQSNTGKMIFDVASIIAHLASMMTLEPGDIIATGTPAGVGFGRRPQEFLKAGDRVTVEIEHLGMLENKFV